MSVLSPSELQLQAHRVRITELEDERCQMIADLATTRAALKRTGEERDAAIEREKAMDRLHQAMAYEWSEEESAIRKLLRDTLVPVLEMSVPHPKSPLTAEQLAAAIERAKEEALKL